MRELVEKIVQEHIEGTHLFLVELTVKPNRIGIALDGDQGVNIHECASLSRRLHTRLEEEGIDTGKITVEVASPGIDRPLQLLREYKKNVGRKLQVKNNQGRLLKGGLIYVDEERIMLQNMKTKNADIIPYSHIKEAVVVI